MDGVLAAKAVDEIKEGSGYISGDTKLNIQGNINTYEKVLEPKAELLCKTECLTDEKPIGHTVYHWEVCIVQRITEQNRGINIIGTLNEAFKNREFYFDKKDEHFMSINVTREVAYVERKHNSTLRVFHANKIPKKEMAAKKRNRLLHREKDALIIRNNFGIDPTVPY